MKVKIFLLIFLLVILISSAKALKITASPAYSVLETQIGEEICKKISLSSDKNILVDVGDRWTKGNRSISLKDYNLSASMLNIEISYPKQIRLIQKENFDVCIVPNKAGIYNGILMFKSLSNSAGVAILIEINVSELESGSFGHITGGITQLNEKEGSENIVLILLFVLSLFLFFIFFLIVKKKH